MAPVKPVKFKPPFVEPGMFVHWLPNTGEKVGVAMLVQEVGADGIGGLLFPPMSTGRYVSGLHHESDPSLDTAEWIRKPGCWRHLKSNQAVLDLVDDMHGRPAGRSDAA
jgi:hypothetical protein